MAKLPHAREARLLNSTAQVGVAKIGASPAMKLQTEAPWECGSSEIRNPTPTSAPAHTTMHVATAKQPDSIGQREPAPTSAPVCAPVHGQTERPRDSSSLPTASH